jgi:GDP-mannose 4,6-dehydratase
MFYDVSEPIAFVNCIKNILHPQGIWVTEQSYCPTMIGNCSFDTVCHEHLGYYSIRQMIYLAEETDMKIVDITMNSINGGSFRVTFTHKQNDSIPITENVQKYTNYEQNLYDSEIIKNNFSKARSDIVNFFNSLPNNSRVYGYGASTKGNTILQYCELTSQNIMAIADRNPDKIGLRMSTGIPIVSEQNMRTNNPDYLFVLPWHFKDEFIERESEYLDRGGRIVFPLPRLIIVQRKKAIITGVDGQIGSYLSDLLLQNNYIVYGITNKKPFGRPKINYHICDIRDEDILKEIVRSILPDEFYNLAAISNADTRGDSHKDELIHSVNAIPLRYICHLCTKYKIRLFQAGSIEMFRGSKKICSTVDNYHARNSYGKSKITADIITRYYRNGKGLFVCNGILSNTESSRRKEGFLFSKLKKEVIECRDSGKILLLGDIFYEKSWIHASDAARAAYQMLQHETPDDYVVCNNGYNTVKDVVDIFFHQVFKQHLIWKEDEAVIVTKNLSSSMSLYYPTEQIVVKTGTVCNRCYEKDEKLLFDNSKLINIGWQPRYNLQQIVEEVLSV